MISMMAARACRTTGRWIAVALMLGLSLIACGSGEKHESAPSADASAPSLRVAARIPVGSNVSQLSAADDRIWIAGGYDGGVRRIDIASGKFLADLTSDHGNLPGGGTALAIDGSMWIA